MKHTVKGCFLIFSVCRQVKPGYIILSARQDERLQQAVFDLGEYSFLFHRLSLHICYLMPWI